MNPETRAEHGIPSSNDTLHVQIGDICCSITCHDRDVFSYLHDTYGNFLSDRPADFSLELDIVERLGDEEIKAISPTDRSIHKWGTRFVLKSRTLRGAFDAASRSLILTVERHLFDPERKEYRFMNRIFPGLYFTACDMKYDDRPPAMLLHACGIVRHNQALIFMGPPDAGKTTIARLCGDTYGRVLNDEMVLCSWPNGNGHPLIIRGTPIIGGVTQRLNSTAPLRCILMLKQSKKTTLRRLDQTEAYTRLMRQVIAPAGIKAKGNKRSLLALSSDFSDEVVKNTTFYELEFNLNRELLWQVVDETEILLEKGVPVK